MSLVNNVTEHAIITITATNAPPELPINPETAKSAADSNKVSRHMIRGCTLGSPRINSGIATIYDDIPSEITSGPTAKTTIIIDSKTLEYSDLRRNRNQRGLRVDAKISRSETPNARNEKRLLL